MESRRMRDILETAESVKPFATVNGKPVVSFDDYMALATADALNGNGLDLVEFNPDGSPAKTPVKVVATNVENYFINRYRQVRKTIQLVTDYRCITSQSSGRIPTKQVPCYVISRGEDGKLKLDKMITVTDTEFLSDFTHSLDREAMSEILPILTAGTGITKDKLAI